MLHVHAGFFRSYYHFSSAHCILILDILIRFVTSKHNNTHQRVNIEQIGRSNIAAEIFSWIQKSTKAKDIGTEEKKSHARCLSRAMDCIASILYGRSSSV
jgi:hypothetical protein